MSLALLLDSVSDVLALDRAQIRPVPELSAAAKVGFITSIGSAPGDGHERMLILVDIELDILRGGWLARDGIALNL
ncbi:Positive regulator of CheA protein activity (CheW) [Caballeronia sordidicola]|uniref:Positive regulator of CheA protein activity (CheW) n=1 Tax=Caballeronia sordidicola TaxID=196367 RepID=A0A242N6I2_CABSO|nr:Positive regulator of CheA protein activity (CheW) [Caballeronia sordidicola]